MPKILTLLQVVSPDIVLIQETQLDPRFGPLNQMELLNAKLSVPYEHVLFSKSETRLIQKKIELPFPVEHGLGIMSRYPIKNILVTGLSQMEGDKEKRIVVTYTVLIDNKEHTFINVHFSNRDDWALAHFKQVLEIASKESIIMGDFNIRAVHFEDMKELYQHRYISSYDYAKYTSFPSEGDTFDYALIPKRYLLKRVVCREEEVSDHRMLLVEMVEKV